MSSAVRTMADAGAVLRAARMARGLTQAEVAARAKVSREWLNEVETGKSRFDFQRYLAACEALGLEVQVQKRSADA
ncbi:helix-turn-helix domain-containing protein [Microbacterium bovistercoris]|uniref:Helix-turn-helix domain-containing protein n=1 Tax=Microbacterium bovistercoris TaxID=2293570 RepID=A0A371NW31_9MICO|nr:helix-turn-helix domain-containing protein [Microbacterium bovistercoris]REJ06764.1 helix-turn-helix domain-containing protein [Microbacterium bovistercoris]